MTHYVMAYDVIRHDVTNLSDIGNETARSRLFVGEVNDLGFAGHSFHPHFLKKKLKS